MEKKKKPYVKPGFIFEDFATGEITGTPEMVTRFKKEAELLQKQNPINACPLGDVGIPCYVPKG